MPRASACGTRSEKEIERRRSANADASTSNHVSPRIDCWSPNGDESCCANAGRTTSGLTRVRIPAPVLRRGLRLAILVALFFAANADGTTASNARGRGFESRRSKDRSSVVEHERFVEFLSLLFCFEVNAGGFTGKSVMVLAMKVPGSILGLLRQVAQYTTRRSSSPPFCFGPPCPPVSQSVR